MLKDLTKKNKLNFHHKLNDLEDSEQELIEEIFTRKLIEERNKEQEEDATGAKTNPYGFKNKQTSFLICKEDLKPKSQNTGGMNEQACSPNPKQKRKRRKSYVEQTPEDFRKMNEEQKLSQKQFKEQILLDRKIGHKQILKNYYKSKEQIKQQNLLQKYQNLATQFVQNKELKSKLDIVQQCVTDPRQAKVNLIIEKKKEMAQPDLQ